MSVHSIQGTNKWGISKDLRKGNYAEDVEPVSQPRHESSTYININNISATLGNLTIFDGNNKRATGPISRGQINLTLSPEDKSMFYDTSVSDGYEVPINHPKPKYLSFDSDHSDSEIMDSKNKSGQKQMRPSFPPRKNCQQCSGSQEFFNGATNRTKFLPLKPAPGYINTKDVWDEAIGTNLKHPQNKHDQLEPSIVTVISYGMQTRRHSSGSSDPIFHIYESIKSRSGEAPCQNQYVSNKEILKDLISKEKRKRSKSQGNICDKKVLEDISTPAIKSKQKPTF